MKFNIENIKEKIKELSKEESYYEEVIFSLPQFFYDDMSVKSMEENIVDQRRWETDTEYIYKLKNEANEKVIFIGVIVTAGNTESQEDEGITDVYEVVPKEVMKVVYSKVKEGENMND